MNESEYQGIEDVSIALNGAVEANSIIQFSTKKLKKFEN